MPSSWVTRFAAELAAGSRALDLACSHGRHARWLHARGMHVTCVDRDLSGIDDLTAVAGIEAIQADLENGPAWPLGGRQFDLVVVTNYLHRPLFPDILNAVDKNGLLIYETFAAGNAQFGRPKNPDFLLQPGELMALMDARFDVLRFADRMVQEPRPAVIQHIAARRREAP